MEAKVQLERERAECTDNSTLDRMQLHQTIDDFMQVHTGFQLLCGHMLQSMKQLHDRGGLSENDGRIGMVTQFCSLSTLIHDAISETQIITERHMEHAPEVLVGKLLSSISV
jgi:hypothetical protein